MENLVTMRPSIRAGEKKVVPWFSVGEWKWVCNQLYSDDRHEHQHGYDRLVAWKARCPSLPPAVECTLGIFQIILSDPDYLTPRATTPLREEELRMMYSTAVMRFLNLMLEVYNEDLSGTMYSRAEMRNIPDWLVNLRHDTAHGKSLPELSLLRAAALFIRKWLFEYYWKVESEVITDWVVSHEEIRASSAVMEELHTIVEAWEALSLYQLAGFNNVTQIPDSELKCSLSAIENILQHSYQHIDSVMISSEYSPDKPSKVSNTLSVVELRLKKFMKQNFHSVEIKDALCDMIISGNVLLPSENLLKIVDPAREEQSDTNQLLPFPLLRHWRGMLCVLWEVETIPLLIKKLISVAQEGQKTDLRCFTAALWAQKLILSCLKVRETRKIQNALAASDRLHQVYDGYNASLPDHNRMEVIASVALAAVEKQREELKSAYTWKPSPLPQSLSSMDLVRHSLSSPPPDHCSLFLPCLFELASPPIPLEIRNRLLELVAFYNNKNQSKCATDGEEAPHSVIDLFSHIDTLSADEANEKVSLKNGLKDVTQNPSPNSSWTRSQGHLNWGSCPLGVLPWQQEQQHHDKEKYEHREQLRTWSRLSHNGLWNGHKTHINDQSNVMDLTDKPLKGVNSGKEANVKGMKTWPPHLSMKAFEFLQGQ